MLIVYRVKLLFLLNCPLLANARSLCPLYFLWYIILLPFYLPHSSLLDSRWSRCRYWPFPLAHSKSWCRKDGPVYRQRLRQLGLSRNQINMVPLQSKSCSRYQKYTVPPAACRSSHQRSIWGEGSALHKTDRMPWVSGSGPGNPGRRCKDSRWGLGSRCWCR